MSNDELMFGSLEFVELEDRFGIENACVILRTLELFEGIPESRASQLSYHDRLRKVMSVMKDEVGYQTLH
jgi:hypothetical protein